MTNCALFRVSLGYKTTVGSEPEASSLVDTVGDLLFLGGSNKPTLTSLSLLLSAMSFGLLSEIVGINNGFG